DAPLGVEPTRADASFAPALVPVVEERALARFEERRAHDLRPLGGEIARARERRAGGVEDHRIGVIVPGLLVVVGPRDDGALAAVRDARATDAAGDAEARMGERRHLARRGGG